MQLFRPFYIFFLTQYYFFKTETCYVTSDHQFVPPFQDACGASDWTQSFIHVKQTIYQLWYMRPGI